MQLKYIIFGVAGFLALVLIFLLGIIVGQERAEFSYQWAADYHKNFGGPATGFMGMIAPQNFLNANGVFGQIIKIDPSPLLGESVLTIKGSDGEKAILADSNTTIRLQKKNVQLDDLKIDEYVVVIGNPNDRGQIKAELIRIMPPVPASKASSPASPAY